MKNCKGPFNISLSCFPFDLDFDEFIKEAFSYFLLWSVRAPGTRPSKGPWNWLTDTSFFGYIGFKCAQKKSETIFGIRRKNWIRWAQDLNFIFFLGLHPSYMPLYLSLYLQFWLHHSKIRNWGQIKMSIWICHKVFLVDRPLLVKLFRHNIQKWNRLSSQIPKF